MKSFVKVEEVEKEGLELLGGERVLLMCANYFYSGILRGVNSSFVKLEDPAIVYETGEWSKKTYSDEQKLPTKFWYVQTSAIESYGLSK